jgi:hypothetical protein
LKAEFFIGYMPLLKSITMLMHPEVLGDATAITGMRVPGYVWIGYTSLNNAFRGRAGIANLK